MSCTSAKPGSSDNPYLPLAALRAEPAASLAPEGVTLIRQVGAEGFMNITGPQAAFYGHVYSVQSSIDDVFAFYDRELAKLGWKPDTKPILSTGELRGWGWCKPQLFFRLALFDPQQYERLGVRDGTQYHTVFDARLQGTSDRCPAVNAAP